MAAASLGRCWGTQVALIFAPQYPFSIGTGFLGMVSFDVLGTIFRRAPPHCLGATPPCLHLGSCGRTFWLRLPYTTAEK